MPDYRIYLMKDGHIKTGRDLECETDDYALSQAQGLLGTYLRAEVWLGIRRVGVAVLETNLDDERSAALPESDPSP